MSVFQPTSSRPAERDWGRTLQLQAPWLASLLAHFVALLVFSLFTVDVRLALPTLVLMSEVPEPAEVDRLLPQEFHVEPSPRETIGSSAVGGLANGEAGETSVEPFEAPALELELDSRPMGQIEFREPLDATTSPEIDVNQAVKGTAGVAVTGADGAIDQITQEILLSMAERPTLVVWFFDRSASLQTQRQSVLRRFNRVYQELGVVEAAGNAAFRRHRDKPLLTSIVAFAGDVDFLIDEPTDDLTAIRQGVESIEMDEGGVERVFSAIHAAAGRYRKYRSALDRQLMFVVFTDEAGDDAEGLDPTVELCRRLAIPVYVVGVPAPFGRKETIVKWVDPDPSFDQTPQRGRVDQGPESFLLEGVQLSFSDQSEDEAPIDSGFGPFALTRLCHETGGIFFAVHPNRKVGRRISWADTATYSAHFSAFFDPLRMRRYRPEYVSAQEYLAQVRSSPLRSSLIQAAQFSAVQPLDAPQRRFVVLNEAQFASELTEAQKAAARIEPTLEQLSQLLATGEAARAKEISPRWQAGFDLAYGRVLANRVRAEGFNSVLAVAKRGLKFGNAKNNTWLLSPDDEVDGGSRLQQQAEHARKYLDRVIHEHDGTPWALLAQRELRQPLGWHWQEAYTPIDPPGRVDQGNDSPAMLPQDEQARMLAPPVKHRPLPKL